MNTLLFVLLVLAIIYIIFPKKENFGEHKFPLLAPIAVYESPDKSFPPGFTKVSSKYYPGSLEVGKVIDDKTFDLISEMEMISNIKIDSNQFVALARNDPHNPNSYLIAVAQRSPQGMVEVSPENSISITIPNSNPSFNITTGNAYPTKEKDTWVIY